MPLTSELRARIAVQAKKRNLKMATAARVFLDEHVRELEDAVELSRSEEWQRAQAWATWEKIRSGGRQESSLDEIRAHFVRAKARLARRARE